MRKCTNLSPGRTFFLFVLLMRLIYLISHLVGTIIQKSKLSCLIFLWIARRGGDRMLRYADLFIVARRRDMFRRI